MGKLLVYFGIAVIILGLIFAYFYFHPFPSFSNVISEANEIQGQLLNADIKVSKGIFITNSSASWTLLKATGDESKLIFWTANVKDKKTEIGWIPKSGSCSGWGTMNIYNLNNQAVLDNQAKPLTIKCESAKCLVNGTLKNCYHLSLTDAQAININTQIKLGTTSSVAVYQDQKRIEADFGFAQANITLYKNVSGQFTTQVNDIWINYKEAEDKFGANDTSLNSTELGQYKYTIESTREIIDNGFTPYVLNPQITQSGLAYVQEAHEFKFQDICLKGYEPYNITWEGDIITIYNKSADCQFAYSNNNKKLEVTFTSDRNIDPTYTISNLTLNSGVQNVKCEADGLFCHLAVDDSQLKLYMPFDVNMTNSNTQEPDWSATSSNGVRSGSVSYNAIGIYGGAVRTSGSGTFTIANNPNKLLGTNGTILFWMNTTWASGDGQDHTFFQCFYNTGIFMRLEKYSDNKYYLGWYNSGGEQRLTFAATSMPVTAGAWNQYAFTWSDSSNFETVYQNGVQKATRTDALVVAAELGLTNCYIDPFSNSNMLFDELMMFNRTLSAGEISAIYNQTFYRFKGDGNQTFNQTIASGNDRMNVTTWNFNQKNSTAYLTNLSLQLTDDGGATWTALQNMSNGVDNIFTIVDTATSINLTFRYIPDPFNFFSPILYNQINMTNWTAGGVADTTPPIITVNNPLPYTNISVSNVNLTLTLNENGNDCDVSFNNFATNYTMSGTTTIFNLTNSSIANGLYSVNFTCNDTSGNRNSTAWTYFNVSYISADTEYPLFSTFVSNPANSSNYTLNAIYRFNTTLDHTNGTVVLEFNNANYTASNFSAVFNSSVSNLPAGTYPYRWFGWGNGTSKNYNTTTTFYYTVNKATSQTSLTFDKTSPQSYPTAITPTCSFISGTGTLSLTNGTSGSPITLGADTWNFNCSYAGNNNFTASSNFSQFIINKNSTLALGLTATSPIIYGTITDFTGSGCPAELTCSLNISNAVYGVGTINANYSTAGNNNYTASSAVFGVTINKAGNPVPLLINGLYANFTGNYPYATNSSVALNSTALKLERNGVDVTATELNRNITLGGGSYVINASVIGNNNYTSNYTILNITILQGGNPIQLKVNGLHANFTGTYPYQTNASTGTNLTALILSRDGVDVTATEWNKNITLGVGSYRLNITLLSNQNYTGNSSFLNITIKQATGNITLHINNTRSNFTAYNNTNLGYQTWLNATLITGTGNIELWLNGTLINSGASPLSNYTNLTFGIYNVTAVYSGNNNYSGFSETWWVNITMTQGLACVQTLANTTKGDWTNYDCNTNQQRQIRNWTQYDTNNCGYVNVTFYEYQLIGNNWQNTTWSSWVTEGCIGTTGYENFSSNLTQYDVYNCGINTTAYRYQSVVNVTCVGPDVTPPVFTNCRNFTHPVNTSFLQSITATDASGIDGYFLNDTTYFNVSYLTGLIVNISSLNEISFNNFEYNASDILGNIATCYFYINVSVAIPKDTSDSGTGVTMFMLLIPGTLLSFGLLIGSRKIESSGKNKLRSSIFSGGLIIFAFLAMLLNLQVCMTYLDNYITSTAIINTYGFFYTVFVWIFIFMLIIIIATMFIGVIQKIMIRRGLRDEDDD